MGEKGCDANSPGIGDVAYVKDLMTEKIVSTNFRCSKFVNPNNLEPNLVGYVFNIKVHHLHQSIK